MVVMDLLLGIWQEGRRIMWYRFNQNNSGGSHAYDASAGISVNVYIEAENAIEANERAESIGIYFNGVDEGYDCSCCGDSWYPAYDYDAVNNVPSPDEPFIIDDNSSGLKPIKWMKDGQAETFIHPLNKPFYGTFQKLVHIKRKVTGYGMYFSHYDVGDIIAVGDDGWDRSGNFQAPSPNAEVYLTSDSKITDYGKVRIQHTKSVFGTGYNYTAWSADKSALEHIRNNMLKYIDSIPTFELESILKG